MDCDLWWEIKEHWNFIAAEKTSYNCRMTKARNYPLEYMSLIMDFTEKVPIFSNVCQSIHSLPQRFPYYITFHLQKIGFGCKIDLV